MNDNVKSVDFTTGVFLYIEKHIAHAMSIKDKTEETVNATIP